MNRMPELFSGDSSPVANGAYLDVADRIGVTLCRDAHWFGNRCSWMGSAMVPIDGVFSPVYQVLDPSLYGGVAGVALFLATLHRFTEDPVQKETALGAVRTLLEQLDRSKDNLTGLYSGQLGIAYTLAQIGRQLAERTLVDRGLQLAAYCAEAPFNSKQTDILSGSAGMIVGLLALGIEFEQTDLLEVAARHGDYLVDRALRAATGMTWRNPNPNEPPLLGYSHGNAGHALALAELDHVQPNARYTQTVQEALRYERALYVPQVRNWPDLRVNPSSPNSGPSYPTAWCHGAAGIGLSRVRLAELLGDQPELTSEIDAALQTASARLVSEQGGDISDFSYCHGSAASAELLLEVALRLGRNDILDGVRCFGDIGARTFVGRGLPWKCGIAGSDVSNPSLMLGTAGIGWFYLRLFSPREVPSLIVIRPNHPQKEANDDT